MTPVGQPERTDGPFTASILPVQLTYALQPIVDVHSGVVYAYEALLRGTEAAGHASIDVFLDASTRQYGSARTEIALHELAMLVYRRLPHPDLKKLFLNVDGRVFSDTEFDPAAIARVADALGIARSAICIELSEKLELGRECGLAERLAVFRASGLRIAIDDFGRGFSELKLLYEVAPEYVKIDRFFIAGIADSARKRLFVSTVANLAHVLGARVIAEGVETQEELQACRRIGCDLVQGWYIARPFRDVSAAPNVYIAARRMRERGAKADAETRLVRTEVQPIPPISIEADIVDVLARLRSTPDVSMFPVVDEADEPLGLIRERDFRDHAYARRGFDPADGRASPGHLRNFVVRAPVVDIASDLDAILESVNSCGEGDGVIVTREMKYAGLLSSSALLKLLNEKRVHVAQDQNPLSRLPGNESIVAFVNGLAGRDTGERVFCYFDFNHFKPFNDTYGFRQGDRAIMLFADVLRRHFGGRRAFLGHVGGDDFFVGMETNDIAGFNESVASALIEFRSGIESFYDPADRARGYISALDRDGVERVFPLMTCSAAILVFSAGRSIETVDLFSKWTADGKRAAKMDPSSISIRTVG